MVVVRLVPLPPLSHLDVAISPQCLPALLAQAGVLPRRLVETGPPTIVGLHLAGELDQALQGGGNLSVPSSSLGRENISRDDNEGSADWVVILPVAWFDWWQEV